MAEPIKALVLIAALQRMVDKHGDFPVHYLEDGKLVPLTGIVLSIGETK